MHDSIELTEDLTMILQYFGYFDPQITAQENTYRLQNVYSFKLLCCNKEIRGLMSCLPSGENRSNADLQ